MKVDMECLCENKLSWEDPFRGYIVTCANCGRKYRGGEWLSLWFRCALPAWFLAWRGRRRMEKFLRKAAKKILAGAV